MSSSERSFHIITDSTADLPEELKIQERIDIIPATITIHGEDFLDGVDLTKDEFLTKMDGGKALPTTAVPSPETFATLYREKKGDILSIHVGSAFSGYWNNAMAAKAELDPEESRISVVDSESTSVGIGFLILEALRLRGEGKTRKEIADVLERLKKRITVLVSLNTFDNVEKGGRINKGQKLLATALQVKPILELRSNVLEVKERPRTRRQSLARMIELVKGLGPLSHLAVIYVDTEIEARTVAEQLKSFYDGTLLFVRTGSALSVHAGRGAVAVAAVQAETQRGFA